MTPAFALVVLPKTTDWSLLVSKGLGCGTKMTQICHKSFLPMSAPQHIFTELSPIAGDLAARSSFEQANLELQDIYNQLRIEDLNLCSDSEELFEAAKRFAEKCHTARSRTQSPIEVYQACLRIVDHHQVKRPSAKDNDLEPALNRMCCSRWWNRRIQILKLRKIETIARNIELVNRLRGTYASDYTIHVKRKQKERNRLYLASN